MDHFLCGKVNAFLSTGVDSSGMKACATPPGEESRPFEVFAEGGGNTGWVTERNSYKCQLRPRARTRIRMDTSVSVVFY